MRYRHVKAMENATIPQVTELSSVSVVKVVKEGIVK